jgi:hypothetical protein
MNRVAILAVGFAAACTGFAGPALAEGDNNVPLMKLYLWDGGYHLETRPQHMKKPKQAEEKTTNATGRGGSMINRRVEA